MKGKNAAYPKAIDELKEKEELAQSVELRQSKYLNNIVEHAAPSNKTIIQTAAWDSGRSIRQGEH